MSRVPPANAYPARGSAHGRYQLLEQLAVGGMGVIHRANDRLGLREVAYKRLSVRDEASRARVTALFQREYDVLARLPHPNVVEVYDYGVDECGPYYTMELLSGRDLAAVSPLPYQEACRVVRDIASALALVHARRLVHRDVSPGNVRLTCEGHAKLIDFGALTPFGQPKELIGTPAFIAPECLEGRPLDQRIDLYALGATFYWALTGRHAVRARNIDELFAALSTPLVPPSQHIGPLPSELDQLVLSLLQHDPLSRPESAACVIDALTAMAELPPEREQRRVAYSYLERPPLVGRESVVEQLSQALTQAIAGAGKALLVEAASGLGRSALLDDLALRAQLGGATVLLGGGALQSAPFGLARHLMQLGLSLYPAVEETLRDGGLRALDLERGQVAQNPHEAAQRHARSLAAAQECLLRLTEHAPIVILVDDVERADNESLALLASLAAELAHARLLLVTSVVAGHAALDTHALARLRASSTRLPLGPLCEQEVVELVRSVFGAVPNGHGFARWLHTQVGGNPGQCLDIARLLLQRGSIRYLLGTFTLPHDVGSELSSAALGDAQHARFLDLSVRAELVANLLSLHDGRLSADQLASATQLSPHELLLASEELAARAVITSTSEGVSLASASLRSAVARLLAPERARALHVQLARAFLLHSDGSLDARLLAAMHFLRGGAERRGAALVEESMRRGELNGQPAAAWIPVLEAVLASYRRQGRRDEQCLGLLMPLARSGFYGDVTAQTRHLDRTLAALSNASGLSLARTLAPYVGAKVALKLGLCVASLRHRLTAPERRIGHPRELVRELVQTAATGVGAAASAFDAPAVRRIVACLDPLSVLPADSGPYVSREFGLASAEISAGQGAGAARRYAALLKALEKPVRGLDDLGRERLRAGCLNGMAQTQLTNSRPVALQLADEMERNPFYAPHGECARIAYYAFRGEQAQADLHRARFDRLLLRGGSSWSAVTVMTSRLAYGYVLSRDAIGLVQTTAELERLLQIAPRLWVCKEVCTAWLSFLRGKPELALAQFRSLLGHEEAKQLSSYPLNLALYAQLLNAGGQHARARELCRSLIARSPSPLGIDGTLRLPVQQWALAEAGLGDLLRASEILDEHLALIENSGNPLVLGNGHRDRAKVALLGHDVEAFYRHFSQMRVHFRSTGNPALVRQCDHLLAEATRRRAELVQQAAPIITKRDVSEDYDGSTLLATREWPRPLSVDV